MDPSKNPVDPNKSPPAHLPMSSSVTSSMSGSSSSRGLASASSPVRIPNSGKNGDDSAAALSEMIDQVLNPKMEDMQPERFNMRLVHDHDNIAGTAAAPDPRRFDERDYQSHRRESFPHIHHPLRPLHSRSLRKKLTSPVKHGAHHPPSIEISSTSPPSSSSHQAGMYGGGGGGGGGGDHQNNEQLYPSQYSTAASSPTKSTHSFSGGVAHGGKSLQSGITPDTPSSGIFSPTTQQMSSTTEDGGREDADEYDDVEPEGAYESCPLLGEPDLELYNLAGGGGGGGRGHGHVAIVPVPQTHSVACSPPGPFDDLIEPVKKVQFEIGGAPVVDGHLESGGGGGGGGHGERRKHRKHSHHYVKYEDPQWRLRQGSQVMEEGPHHHMLQMQRWSNGEEVTQEDIGDMDRDELAAHRFGDNKGFRRHRFFFNKVPEEEGGGITVVAGGEKDKDKPVYDHQPHEVYVELDVLHVRGHMREWKETARWIKYEEDLEEGADRWGRPHIASLSFHSLINLRRLIEAGVTILDMEERDLPGVAYRVVAAMAVNELISDEDKPLVMKNLLSKHRHVNDDERPWRFHLTRRDTRSGSLTSLHAMLEDKNRNNSSKGPMSNVEAAFEGLTRRSSAASRLGGQDSSGMNPEFQFISQGAGKDGRDHRGHHHHVSSPRSVSFRGHFPFSSSATDTNLNQQQHSQHQQQKGQHVAISLAKFSLSNLSEEDVKWITNKENILRRIPVGAEAGIVLVGQDDALEQPILAFVRLAEAVIMPNTTELPIPVRFIFIVLGPPSIDFDYKEIGRSISTLMSNTHFHEIAYKANDRKDLLKGIHEFLDESIVLPPGEWDGELFPFEELREKSQALRRQKERRRSLAKGLLDPGDSDHFPSSPPPGGDGDPLRRTKRPFGGLINDVKRRYPKYPSDITDGFNFQTFACIIFIYFAAVSGAIAFGGILGDKTQGHIGITETLLATAGSGLIFSLFSGQPLLIIGTTGPLLLFDSSLYDFCRSQHVDYLGFRFWVGVWVFVIGVVSVAAEGSILARYFSRFVQEIFSALISLLFMYDAISKVVKIYEEHPIQFTYGTCNNTTQQDPQESQEMPNTALLSSILCFGTFFIAYTCRGIRDSDYFTAGMRKFLGNFAVPIGIIIMVGLDRILVNHAKTDKLQVPPGFSNTKPRDSWFVDATDVSVGMIFFAAMPAFLVFILIFMETSICGRLISKKDNKLKKGTGFHIDIFLVALINALCTSIGGCWVCAATVRAVSHTTSLVIYSTNNPPGEKPAILGVAEQRVSNFVVSVLLGVSVLMSPILVLIPQAVLFGVLLYMGISSMKGVQLFERIALLFKQVSNHPQVPYVRRVRTSKMHLFTTIQICCLAILWAVKSSPAALAVPFVLMMLVPFRTVAMTRMFKPHELAALDADGSDPPEHRPSRKLFDPKEASVMVIEDDNMNKLQQPNGNAPTSGDSTEPDPPLNGIPERKELKSIW